MRRVLKSDGGRALALLIAGLLATVSTAVAAAPDYLAPLKKAHAESADALKNSPFGKPLTIQSSEGKGRLEGTVRAVVEQPYAEVRKTLVEPARWCELLMLIPNIASCSPDRGALKVGLVKRFDAAPDTATPIRFSFESQSSEQGLSIALAADKGPVGTRDYEIELGAIPLDGGKSSFLQMRYAYAYGASAKFAAKAYLSTSGSSKVGFSDGGKIGGLRGALERNAMRYYLAIDAQLAAAGQGAGQRYATSLKHWLKAIEQYPKQLKEDDPKAYSAAKLRNFGAGKDNG